MFNTNLSNSYFALDFGFDLYYLFPKFCSRQVILSKLWRLDEWSHWSPKI